jgi:hypothetical protein
MLHGRRTQPVYLYFITEYPQDMDVNNVLVGVGTVSGYVYGYVYGYGGLEWPCCYVFIDSYFIYAGITNTCVLMCFCMEKQMCLTFSI